MFQPPLLEESINPLSHLCLEGPVQVIQTSKTVDVNPINSIEVSFLMPYVELLDDFMFERSLKWSLLKCCVVGFIMAALKRFLHLGIIINFTI